LHGRDGKGRFKAFALANIVTWTTVYKTTDGYQTYSVVGRKANLSKFSVGIPKAADSKITGTTVQLDGIASDVGSLSLESSIVDRLSEHFAMYLSEYPAPELYFRGARIDPKIAEKQRTRVDLSPISLLDGRVIEASLEIIEWKSARDRKLCLCDERGFTFHEVDAGIRPGPEFNFTAYLRSKFIKELNQDNNLALVELNPDLLKIIELAKVELRSHFRKRKAENVAELVGAWKAEGIYPFAGEAQAPVDKARREIFDICAINVHEYMNSFRDGAKKDRKFTLEMLKAAIDENPGAIKRVLQEVLELPKEKQNELAELLEKTTLSAIIEASKLVTDRLAFLKGLEELVQDTQLSRKLKERSQLHKMLENESWIFGEEFHLTHSDESLTTVLEASLSKLRPALTGKKKPKIEPVKRDDGRTGVIDLMLAREVPHAYQGWREFLVVELKRPVEKISLDVKAQIESYALAVASDSRFDQKNTRWTFLAVSREMTPDAARTVKQKDKPIGYFFNEENVRVGLATWSEIIHAAKCRLEFFQQRLNYQATCDHGIELLHRKYSEYVPS
jgi:hypothetical protein